MTPRLTLHLLGGFALVRDARPCDIRYEKGRALLAYLAAEPGRAHLRESLAALFWTDMIRETALTNLRRADLCRDPALPPAPARGSTNRG